MTQNKKLKEKLDAKLEETRTDYDLMIKNLSKVITTLGTLAANISIAGEGLKELNKMLKEQLKELKELSKK